MLSMPPPAWAIGRASRAAARFASTRHRVFQGAIATTEDIDRVVDPKLRHVALKPGQGVSMGFPFGGGGLLTQAKIQAVDMDRSDGVVVDLDDFLQLLHAGYPVNRQLFEVRPYPLLKDTLASVMTGANQVALKKVKTSDVGHGVKKIVETTC